MGIVDRVVENTFREAPTVYDGPLPEPPGTKQAKQAKQQAPVAPPQPRKLTDLLKKEFKPTRWAVPGLLTEGAVILGGRPKMGKSLLALNLGMSVACGGKALGHTQCEAGDVLYLALEDGERRLKDRTLRLLAGEQAPDRFEYETTWPDLANNGLDFIEAWLMNHPDARLIVVDTLKKLRPSRRGNEDIYDYDYNAMNQFHELALRYGVCILIVHHTRKAQADDFIEELSGSNGISGAVDGIMVLKRMRGSNDAELHITGRDIDESALALRFTFPSWALIGDAAAARLNQERRVVLAALVSAGRSLGIKEVLEAIETLDPKANYNVVKQRLFQMKEAGLVTVSAGKYEASGQGRSLLSASDISPNQPNYSNYPNQPNQPNRAVESDEDGRAVTPVTAVRTVRAVRAGDTPSELPPGYQMTRSSATRRVWITNGNGFGEYAASDDDAVTLAWDHYNGQQEAA